MSMSYSLHGRSSCLVVDFSSIISGVARIVKPHLGYSTRIQVARQGRIQEIITKGKVGVHKSMNIITNGEGGAHVQE